MLKIILLAYSRGIVKSRRIEQACRENVLFIAISALDLKMTYVFPINLASNRLGKCVASVLTFLHSA